MSPTRGTRASFARRGTALFLAVGFSTGLAGCSVLDAGGSEAPLSGIAACALGHTWTTDLADAAEKVSEVLLADQVPVTAVAAEGTQTLEWSQNQQVVLTSDFTLTITTAPAADQVLTIVETHSGTATGAAYINGEVAIPRKWDGTGVNIDTVAENNGTVLEELPFIIPQTSFDDAVGLELTCDGSTLTIHPRGQQVTQVWTRSD